MKFQKVAGTKRWQPSESDHWKQVDSIYKHRERCFDRLSHLSDSLICLNIILRVNALQLWRHALLEAMIVQITIKATESSTNKWRDIN